jgi:hypothetical protein
MSSQAFRILSSLPHHCDVSPIQAFLGELYGSLLGFHCVNNTPRARQFHVCTFQQNFFESEYIKTALNIKIVAVLI